MTSVAWCARVRIPVHGFGLARILMSSAHAGTAHPPPTAGFCSVRRGEGDRREIARFLTHIGQTTLLERATGPPELMEQDPAARPDMGGADELPTPFQRLAPFHRALNRRAIARVA